MISLMACKKSLAKTPTKERRIFGRRSGKALNKSRAQAIETLLPALQISEDDLAENADLSLDTLFKERFEENCLEIGFGAGEHLTSLLKQKPKTGFLGVEPYLNGMGTFLRDIKELPHNNIRVLMDDAMFVVNSLEDECLDKIYILNPDPWHKKRHHKRRIINAKNLDQFARILKPGGMLITSTDVPYLAEWIVTHAYNHSAFTWAANNVSDWKTRPNWWLDHQYATKGAKGATEMHYLIFHKS